MDMSMPRLQLMKLLDALAASPIVGIHEERVVDPSPITNFIPGAITTVKSVAIIVAIEVMAASRT